MKIEELHEVRELTKEIFLKKPMIEDFKELALRNPSIKEIADDWEKKILESEKRLAVAIPELRDRIEESKKISGVEKVILICRYVFLEEWKNIQNIIRYSRSQMFFLHRRAIEKILTA